MLILSLHVGEKFYIGEHVTGVCVEHRNHRCRIGIQAPPHVAVDREVVRKAINSKGGVRKWPLQEAPAPITFAKKMAIWLKGAIESAKSTGDDKLPIYETMLAEAMAVIEADMELAT